MIEVAPDEMAWRATRQDGRVFLVSHAQRVGVASYIAAIEWYWYAPGTARNRFYDAYATKWADIYWIVVSFPEGRFDAARSLARRLGLRIADGVPTLVGPAGPTFFPGGALSAGRENRAMFTIENDGRDSPVYKNNRRDNEAMRQADLEVSAVLQKGVRLTPAQIVDYIYGPGFPAPGAG